MARRTWRFYLPKVVIRLGVVALVALALQSLVIYAALGDVAPRVILVVSYLLLLAFVMANLRRPGLVIIGAGLLLNFLAIAGNGGLMPVTPGNLERAGALPEDVSSGDAIPRSKNVLLARDDTRLPFLTDILVWKNPARLEVFSVGDLIIGAGLVVMVGELLLPRVQRVPRDRPSLT